jgi:hypothetical protein
MSTITKAKRGVRIRTRRTADTSRRAHCAVVARPPTGPAP